MSTHADPSAASSTPMSPYEIQVWNALDEHWNRRANKRGVPNWLSNALDRTGEAGGKVVHRVVDFIPDAVTDPIHRAGEVVAERAAVPALHAAVAVLELVNDWARELNNPKTVEKLARKQGLTLESFVDLREQDLKKCDRLLSFNTLTWRTAGALEGGSMGVLALVPVAGIPLAIGADILVIQVLSTAIASRIAYSYGFDAKDPAEQAFVQRLVQRSFVAQAAKAGPVREAARAAHAVKGRVRWSDKLRSDHRLLAVLEKLLGQMGPAGAKVPVQHVAKVAPFVGILIGAGTNSAILGNVAADAQRYCQTRFLSEKYGLPLPVALLRDEPEEEPASN